MKERKKTKNLRQPTTTTAATTRTTTTKENFEAKIFEKKKEFRDYVAKKGVSIGVNIKKSFFFVYFFSGFVNVFKHTENLTTICDKCSTILVK